MSIGRSIAATDALIAGAVAAVVSGIPSTVHAVARGRDPLAATLAAGSLILPNEHRRSVLLAAAVPVHLGLSLAWAAVLAAVLPPRRAMTWGAAAGLLIAAIDLGTIGRFAPRIRALPAGPQVVDHILYGATVGAVLSRRWRDMP